MFSNSTIIACLFRGTQENQDQLVEPRCCVSYVISQKYVNSQREAYAKLCILTLFRSWEKVMCFLLSPLATYMLCVVQENFGKI